MLRRLAETAPARGGCHITTMYPPPLTVAGDAVDSVPVTRLDEVVIADYGADGTGRTVVIDAPPEERPTASETPRNDAPHRGR